jgi:HEAT repeat protein
MPKHNLPSATNPFVILAMSLLIAVAVVAAVYGVVGAMAVILFAYLAIIVSNQRWSRWAVAPAKRIDLANARRQLERLDDRRRSVRWRAANVLRSVGPDCAPIVPELIMLLAHSDWLIQSHACEALGAIGPGAKEAIPALIEMLKEGPFPAVFALRGIGPDAKAAVPLLIEHLRAGTGNCETCVAVALWKIEQKPDLAVPALLDVLNGESAPLRRGAVDGLSRIGPSAEVARPALIHALRDKDRWVRKGAAKALARIALST